VLICTWIPLVSVHLALLNRSQGFVPVESATVGFEFRGCMISCLQGIRRIDP
jgi:hypothetical protein